MKNVFLLFAVLFLANSCSAKTSITVSAAASLKDVLTEVARNYHDVNIRFNFASSGTLQRQIESGAPIDLYISAADSHMDALQQRKLIDAGTRRVLARNRLVLIVPNNSKLRIQSFGELKNRNVKRFAIGAPQSVPAGKYAQQVLMKIGIWKGVSRKAVRSKDVREVLTQVELGNADAGIVYRTDAARSSRVCVVAVAPENYHAPIRYPMAVVSDSRKKSAAKEFAAFLQSAAAKKVLRKNQFVDAG